MWQVVQSALPTVVTFSSLACTAVPEVLLCTSWQEAHSTVAAPEAPNSILLSMVPTLPVPMVAAVLTARKPGSAVTSAALYGNPIGWSLLRSVPSKGAPVTILLPVAPPKLSIATVPSWQDRQSLETAPGCPVVAFIVELTVALYSV